MNLQARLLRAYEAVAHREWLACTVVLLLTLGLRAALLPWFPQPVPAIHDEFAYLLAADTFASGHITNPAHPLWPHFQTFHELMLPTYSSKYPPLQGLVLAFGQKLFGNPWIGVFLSTGLMCALLCWALQGWLTPNLAFLGGLLAALHIGIFDYWMNSYWGGSVAAIGGALSLGAAFRIWRRGQTAHLVTLAAGLAILMHSRPWEGFVLGAELLGMLLWAWRRFPRDTRSRFRAALLPAAAILAISTAAMLYFDYRVTGSPWMMPHQLFDQQHQAGPMFVFLPLRTVDSRFRLRDGPDWEAGFWQQARHDPLTAFLEKLGDIYNFFFGLWPLLVPPLVWPYRLRTAEERMTVLLLILFLLIAIAPVTVRLAHYAAPITALLYARFLQTLARLHRWRPNGRPLGPALNVFFLTLLLYQFAANIGIAIKGGFSGTRFSAARAAIVKQLSGMPGQQLVLVHYAPDQTPFEEWIWNRADIDASQTVWARQFGPQQDQELLDYYPQRRVWLLDAATQPERLLPYPAPAR